MEYDRDIKCDYFDSSCVVSSKPCWLFSIIATSSQDSSKILTVRNGTDTQDEIKFKLSCINYNNVICIFNNPIYFDKGLYLQFATNVDNVTLQYKPVY